MGHAPLNLYRSLGVVRADTAAAIRLAYRDLAWMSRPATDAVPAFVQEIDLACAVLSDGTRRAHYDRRLASGSELSAPAQAVEPGDIVLDLLHDFDGGPPSREEIHHSFRSNFAPGAEPKSGRVVVLDLCVRVHSAAPEVADVICLGLPVFHACVECHGTGSVACCECTTCDGTGLVEERETMRLSVFDGDRMVSLDAIGVRSPILRLRVTATT